MVGTAVTCEDVSEWFLRSKTDTERERKREKEEECVVGVILVSPNVDSTKSKIRTPLRLEVDE